jgi:hypothetical protein
MQPINFRASHAGSCPRRIQLEAWGVEGLPPWEGMERAFAEGNMHERDILEWAAANISGGGWKLRGAQKSIIISQCELFVLTGHIDAQLFAKGKGRHLLEAKALAKRGYQELVRTGEVRVAHPQYYDQVQLYLHGLQHYPQDKAEDAYLVARDKDTPKNKMWNHYVEYIKYDPCYVDEIIVGLYYLACAIRDNEPIRPPYNPDEDWRCRPPWCPYTYECYPGYKRAADEVAEARELLPDVERYQELSEVMKDVKDEKDSLNQKIKDSLTDGEFMVGNYIVKVATQRDERVDSKKVRELVDPLLLPQLLKIGEKRVLGITGAEEQEG